MADVSWFGVDPGLPADFGADLGTHLGAELGANLGVGLNTGVPDAVLEAPVTLGFDSFFPLTPGDSGLVHSPPNQMRARALIKDDDVWFLTGQSWQLQHVDMLWEPNALDSADHLRYLHNVQGWLQQWVGDIAEGPSALTGASALRRDVSCAARTPLPWTARKAEPFIGCLQNPSCIAKARHLCRLSLL